MEIKSMQFKARAAGSLANVALQGNLMNAKGKFVTKRAEAIKMVVFRARRRIHDRIAAWLGTASCREPVAAA